MLILLFIFTLALACPESPQNFKRADGNKQWNYESTHNWGSLNSSYSTCQTGSQQSPIPLSLIGGLASKHLPQFSEEYASVSGHLYNWGYGPAFSVDGKASMTYDNITLYLKGWHIHAPADHTVGGARSKAELHLVHADASGKEKGVVSIRIDPGNGDSEFFSQFVSSIPGFTSTNRMEMTLDIMTALKEVNMFQDFWTYEGSLTSPPCTEGIRWWIARNILWVGNGQMQEILAASTYSSRVEQQVWLHGINQ